METPGVIARISLETQLHHSDADAELERLLAEPSATAYRSWLLTQHGFLAPLEAAFDRTPRLAAAIDLRGRRKVPRVRSDLLALGVSQPSIAASPACIAVPATFTRISIAFGWMYAVERSILQYSNAFRRLARSLPGEVAFASSYLKCYETNIGVMWRTFATAVELACARPDDANELVQSAQDAFRCLRRWNHQGGALRGTQSAWVR